MMIELLTLGEQPRQETTVNIQGCMIKRHANLMLGKRGVTSAAPPPPSPPFI